jgi:Flp pilus assembly protein protease CpaA
MELYLLDILLVIFIILYLLIASIFDLKTREVPDLLSYSLIIIVLSLRLIFSIISKNFSFFIFGLLGFIVFFIVANLMYYTKQWGGGDAKLLMGIGAALPMYPQSLIAYFNPSLNQIPFLLVLFLNLIIIGAAYALVYSIIISIRYKDKIKKEFSSTLSSKHFAKIRKIIIFSSLVILVYGLIQPQKVIRVIISMVIISVLFLFYLIIFLKSAEKAVLIKKVNVKKLTPGDWINQKIIKKEVIYDPKKGYGVTQKQIDNIISSGIKEVEIKEGMPFVPSFFIAVVLTLLYGNIIFRIMGL